MNGRRVWTRPGGLVLAHDPDGWPLPGGHIEATAGSYWTTMWDRIDVWPCHWTHYNQTCQHLAVWRTVEHRGWATWRAFYCDAHLPHLKPADPPGQTCDICTGPLDPWLTTNEHTTHPCCASTGTVTYDDAIATITNVFARGCDMTTTDLHRIHISTTEHGFEARCVCGWSTIRRSRELRQADIDQHHAVCHAPAATTASSAKVTRSQPSSPPSCSASTSA